MQASEGAQRATGLASATRNLVIRITPELLLATSIARRMSLRPIWSANWRIHLCRPSIGGVTRAGRGSVIQRRFATSSANDEIRREKVREEDQHVSTEISVQIRMRDARAGQLWLHYRILFAESAHNHGSPHPLQKSISVANFRDGLVSMLQYTPAGIMVRYAGP